MSWTVIVPVKRLSAAKTRLRGALGSGQILPAAGSRGWVPGAEAGGAVGNDAGGRSARGRDADHESLVLAMALDTMAAALASPVVGRVVVVTADPLVAQEATLLGAEIITDVPDVGLNPALAFAAAQVRRTGPSSTEPGVVALTADVPALRSEQLTTALREAEQVGTAPGGRWASTRGLRAFVADAAGTGTVLLAAPPEAVLEPCFGVDSAAAHAASGAVALAGDWPNLRRDVDTPADLAEAFSLGLGLRTTAALAATSWQPRAMLANSAANVE